MYQITCVSQHTYDGFILTCIKRTHHAGDHESFEGLTWPPRHPRNERF